MIWRIEVRYKNGVLDSLGEKVHKDITEMGWTNVSKVETRPVFYIEGDFPADAIKTMAHRLLTDSVTQECKYAIYQKTTKQAGLTPGTQVVEIAYHRGVMDPVEESTIKGIRDLGFQEVEAVRTAKKYIFFGKLSSRELDTIVSKVLANKLIQHVVDHAHPIETFSNLEHVARFELILVNCSDASEKQLRKLSQDGQLFLNLEEMKTIQKYFRKIGRNPTDCELETIAQTWSEHCYHKTFRGNIRYVCQENGKKKTKLIRNLFKSTIVKATQEINKPWCVSVFHDNAGVIRFDEDSHVCFKVETHNHPSALEPFGGASTGIGGVIRDILGTGLGAKPICSTDVFCFAPPDTALNEMPPGTLHPKRVMKGVVSGVRDYGNKMGIPTVNGAVLFHPRFVGNPLVYCGNIGIMPHDKVWKKPQKGDLVVVVGGRTGRDGIHGATFSSGELTTDSEVISSGAVQIGDPIREKKMMDVLMKARDLNLYSAITDCGAGGLSSAVGEMGANLGARVYLEKVPLKYTGLKYTEIWISESQERMVLAVPPKNRLKLLDVFAQENVEAAVIGEFTNTKRLELFYQDAQVCDLDMDFLHAGPPRTTKEAYWHKPALKRPRFPNTTDYTPHLLKVLSHYNICSKEWIIRQYDHEVQGGSIIKPLSGVQADGPSDASVITPKLGKKRGIAVSNGINVYYGMLDPFWMAASCIDEAIRQVIAIGGSLEHIAILDNFCWGNPDKPDRLGALVRAAEGCYRAAVEYGVPFISGKDSLYNEYTEGKKSIAIPGTLLISAIGIIDDVSKAVTMDFKEAGNLIYSIGLTKNELGGSVYLDTLGQLGCDVPQVNYKRGIKIFQALSKAVQQRLLCAVHDCSDGGLAVALAEMAFSGGYGVTAQLPDIPYEGKDLRDNILLFSESNSRFIVEVRPEHAARFERLIKGVPYGLIGQVEQKAEFKIFGLKENKCVDTNIQALKDAWQKPLRW